jgi:O-antigen ligase
MLASTGGHFGGERIAGTQGNANLFAFVLLISCVLSLDLLKRYKNIIPKGALLCNIGMAFPFILATGSRKGLIGFFFLLCFETINTIFSHKPRKRLGSLVFGVLGLGLAFAIFFQMLSVSPHLGRLQNLERFAKGKALVQQENSLGGRLSLYRRGVELAMKRPLFGVGLDMFRFYDSALKITTVDQTYSHSNVVEVLADTGFLGFAIYYSAYILIAFRIMASRKRCDHLSSKNYLYLSSMIIALVMLFDCFSVTYYEKNYWIALTIVLCSIEFVNSKPNSYNKFDRENRP